MISIIDQLDVDGNSIGLSGPIDVVRFGDSLRDKTTGMCWAIKDGYGDWVSPLMYSFGVKSVMVVEETDKCKP